MPSVVTRYLCSKSDQEKGRRPDETLYESVPRLRARAGNSIAPLTVYFSHLLRRSCRQVMGRAGDALRPASQTNARGNGGRPYLAALPFPFPEVGSVPAYWPAKRGTANGTNPY